MESHVEKKIERAKQVFENTDPGKRFLFQFLLSKPQDLVQPYLRIENADARVEYSKRAYEFEMEVSRRLDDDYIPRLSAVTGTEIFAESLGCKVFYPENNNPCAIHFINDPSEAAKIARPKLEDTPLMKLFDMADKLYAFGGKDALLSIVDLQSPMDVVAQIWDKSSLLISMIEDPEVVHELADKAYSLITEFLDEWFRRYGKMHIAHYPSYLLDGGVSMSVDEVGIIGPDMFEEFFAEELNRLSRRYGGIGIHCCAVSDHQFENFSKIEGLKLINLYRPEKNINKAYEIFKDVCVQCHGDYIDGIPRYVGVAPIESFPVGSRVMMRENVETLDEALEKCERYAKIYR